MAKELQVYADKFDMVLQTTLNLPGVYICRRNFLRKELSKFYPDEIVEKAIALTPAQAGITVLEIERIAKECINYETNKVSMLSFVAGIPGGVAGFALIPADMAQYFAHIVLILQKLIYLYGWPEITSDENLFDDETSNLIILFIGVMFGVNAANKVIVKIAAQAGLHAEKAIAKKALTKGVIYPVVKKVTGILGYKITKSTFAKNIGKAIPVIGGIVSGAVTYGSFKPSAIKLKEYLKKLPLADFNANRGNEVGQDIDERLIDPEYDN